MAEHDLKSCPFCGGEARMTYSDRGEIWQVRCNNWTGTAGSKSCMGGGAYAYTEAEAIALWNRRASIPTPDQTNAEVSDERLREIEQAILLLRPAGNIAYNMKQGIVSPNAGGAPYEFGRINDAVNAAIKLLSSARRSVTSQASEGEVAAYRYRDRANGPDERWIYLTPHSITEGPSTILSMVLGKPAEYECEPLYASPSKRVERLEAALSDIAFERERQKSVEGWTAEHDDTHVRGELAQAAAAYAYYATDAENGQPAAETIFPTTWDDGWFKPTNHRRNLVKAGALIVADIERIDRQALGDRS